MDRSDADRLKLLDRIAERVPELDLDRNYVEWTTLAPILEGWIGCIVIKPDGSRELARAVPDPLAHQ